MDKKNQLIGFGAEILADSLLELSRQTDAALEMVERLLAPPQENINRFKAKLYEIKRMRRFLPWKESASFARHLEMLLGDLKYAVDDPLTGISLVASFFEAEEAVFNQCDDSDGHVGNVYRFDAADLFVFYAAGLPDKERLCKVVFELNRKDDYGIRDALVHRAADYLPEPDIRRLIEWFQDSVNKESNEFKNRRWLRLVESLARQIRDAELFEKTRLTWNDAASADTCVDIARVYLESGDPRRALSWLEEVSDEDLGHVHDRDRLLLEIHGRMGAHAKQSEVAWRIFKRYRSPSTFDDLLAVIGREQRETAIASEIDLILKDPRLFNSDAAFMVAMDRLEDAEHYLLDRADQINGDFYTNVLPLAEAMENDGRVRMAIILYRALLDSILQRAKSKAYTHGVRYLKRIERLATKVSDWKNLEIHAAYMQRLRSQHGRKRSFWMQYDH